MHRLLTVGRSGASSFQTPPPPPPPESEWDNAAAVASATEAVFPANAYTVTVGGEIVEYGHQPVDDYYPAIWTRDQALTLWHYPAILTATQRQQFIAHRLATRSTVANSGYDDFICDRIDATGNVVYKNWGKYPFMDGIQMLILVLWADWKATGSLTTFTTHKAVIDDCLAALPRSGNGCVYSDPADPSSDWGFTDVVHKTGDVAMGTALLTWAYKMMAEMNGESGSGTYTTLRATAAAGLETLRQGNGFYQASSGNEAGLDDVWCTALAVAEGLVSGTDRTDSATALRDAYVAGNISDNGYIRHLPVGQYWVASDVGPDGYQNGGFWLTPLWNVYRAINLVDPTNAHQLVQEALDTVESEIATFGGAHAPVEWRRLGLVSPARGYTAHAALLKRFV